MPQCQPLLSMFYDFHYKGNLLPWLNLFLVIYFACTYCEWDYFQDFFLSEVYMAYKMLLISVCWFCMLLIVSWWSLGFPVCRILSSVNRDNLTSSLPVCTPFISSSCLLACTKTFSTIFYQSSESEHLRLVPNSRGNTFSFSQFSVILAVGLLYTDFIMLMYQPIQNLLSTFIMKKCWILSNDFLHLLRWSYDFFYSSFWCDILCLFICLCWTIHTSLG